MYETASKGRLQNTDNPFAAHDCQSKQWWSEEDKTTHNVTTLQQQLLYDDKHEGEVRMLARPFFL